MGRLPPNETVIRSTKVHLNTSYPHIPVPTQQLLHLILTILIGKMDCERTTYVGPKNFKVRQKDEINPPDPLIHLHPRLES